MASLFMTGGSGFIGKNFLSKYSNQFDRIILPLRSAPNFPLPDHVTVKQISGNPEEIAAMLLEYPCAHVLNAAAYGVTPNARDVDSMIAVNTDIPVQLAEAAQKTGAEKFVQLGTMSEYKRSNKKRPVLEQDNLIEEGASYGGCKAQAHRRLKALAGKGDTQIVCLRLFGVYGPGEGPHRLIPSLYAKLSTGAVAPMSAGSQVRDFIYISDVLSAISKALTTPLKKQFSTFNIGSGVGVSVADFAKALCKTAGFKESQIGLGMLPLRDTDVPYIVANIEAAAEWLGWAPEYTVERGLNEYVSALS